MARRSDKTIEERAKQAGATGPRLTAAKQGLRDSLIVARRAQGCHLDAYETGCALPRRPRGRRLPCEYPLIIPSGQPSATQRSAASWSSVSVSR